MSKIIDISVNISNKLVTWPGDPEINIRPFCSISKGDKVNVLDLSFGSHTGTHIDSPYHFIKRGKSVDKISLDLLMGECLVKEIRGDSITINDVIDIEKNQYSRILFKTKNSKNKLLLKRKFDTAYVYLSYDAAKICVDKGIKVIGVDYLSIEKYKGDGRVHNLLLKNEIVIIEGLNLYKVKPDVYELIALPLKINKGDGAPSRVVLRVIE